MIVNRPMLWISASFVTGIFLTSVASVEVACFVSFCSLVLLCVLFFRNKDIFSNVVFSLCFILLCLGIVLSGFAGDMTQKPLYAYCGETVSLTGEAAGNITKTERYIRFQMNVTSASNGAGETQKTSEKVLVTVFKDEEENTPCPDIKVGDVVATKCTLYLPDVAENTDGFDYRKYLRAKGIYFTATTNQNQIEMIDHNDHIFYDVVHMLRNKCSALIDEMFPTEDSGVIKAYILGDKSGMNAEVSDTFSASGLSHVLAVSGMHVAVFLASLTAFLTLIKFPKKQQRYLLVFATIIYVVFTGASIATVRAGIVCVIAIVAQILYRKSDALTALSEAAAVLCAMNPYIFYDVSFLLSFTASLGIILFSQKTTESFSFIYKNFTPKTFIYRVVKYCVDLICVGVCANVFMIPVLIHVFKEISVFSVIATLIVSPVLSPMLMSGLLFCVVGLIHSMLATPFAGFLYVCTKAMVKVAEFFGEASFSKVAVGNVTPFFLLCYIVIVLLLYFVFVKRNKRGYFFAISSVLVLFLSFCIHYRSNITEAEVSFINVGQGDCSLIKAPGNCDILIDAGGKENDGSVGENVIAPYLLNNGVTDIEYAIASHGHVDHMNGLIDLMDVIKVKHLLLPKGFGASEESMNLIKKAESKHIPITYLMHGDMIKIGDDMTLRVIMPDEKMLAFLSQDDENDRSLLLRLEYGDVSFLFTGDLSMEAENYAAAMYPDLVCADVLKVGHHGSTASNSEKFLNHVQPVYAYIPVGKNQYGLPSETILNRLKEFDIQYYRADVHKDVTFYFDTNRIKGIKYDERITKGGSYELR